VVDIYGGDGGANGLCKRCMNKHGLCCWASWIYPRCSSLHSECAFIFGSCRTFYGEKCLQGPPPVPVPPGYEDLFTTPPGRRGHNKGQSYHDE
jgi:hypothetical protein